jgi:multidrug transporter EmrE-like cation transporter
VGAALYGLSFLLWMFILSRSELSVAYPVVIGATLMATTLASWLLLKEPINALRLAGVAVIFLGVIVVARS